MSKACSVCKDWDFVSRGTEISVGSFLMQYFTPLTLERQHQSALSDEDVTEVWSAAKLEAIRKVRKMKGEVKGTEAPNPDEKEVEKTFWLSRPDGWVVNKKTKRIIMLEFKRASDTTETYYSDMREIVVKQHTPILEGLNSLEEERGWGVEVLPLVTGQRSVREKEWIESMKTFYWRQVFGPSSSLIHLLGKGLSVRASNSL